MDDIVSFLPYAFYTATLLALAFFIHKVFWLVQYKRLQSGIVDAAVARLREGNAKDLAEWDELAKSRWSLTLGKVEVSGPSTFIRRVEEGLGQVRKELRSSRQPLERLVAEALRKGADKTSDKSGEKGSKAPVLSIRRLSHRAGDERYEVGLDLRFPSLPVPRAPDGRLYELNVRSRYGFWRRALVFFSGAADVVYSSQHIALMSQNTHVPTSVIVRRLSLVGLVFAVIFVDVVFRVKAHIAEACDEWLRPVLGRGFLGENLPHALGFLAWIAIYGSIYLALYFSIRRRYQVNVKKLRDMMRDKEQTMKAIHDKHVGELVRWGAEYGRSLDNAVEITLRHAETLIDHYGDRLRRRIAGPALLEGAKTIADCLFMKLPESRGDLQDAATSHKHSFRHYLWPRAEEMEYQERLAQYRAAWQELELAVAELRREQPDPALSHALWRSATSYAAVFAPLLPSGMADNLRQAYAQMVTECVSETDKDLAELDRRLGELRRSLAEQLEAGRSLVTGRVELTQSQIHASVAELAAEVISVREQARLEAMAFEI